MATTVLAMAQANGATPTGTELDGGRWKEYSEQPDGHSVGYFWLRADGLRAGVRVAGNYYVNGAQPQPVREPYVPGPGHPGTSTGQAAYDGALVFDVVGDLREQAKKTYLPAHIRIVQNGQVRYISQVNNRPVMEVLDSAEKLVEIVDALVPATESVVVPVKRKRRKSAK